MLRMKWKQQMYLIDHTPLKDQRRKQTYTGLSVNLNSREARKVLDIEPYDKLKRQHMIWALDLSKYMDDLDAYVDGALDPFFTTGALLALPHPAWMVGMRLNLTARHKIICAN